MEDFSAGVLYSAVIIEPSHLAEQVSLMILHPGIYKTLQFQIAMAQNRDYF